MNNKQTLKFFAQVVALMLWTLLVIISCAGLWNAAAGEKPSSFYIGASVVLFIVNGVVIFLCARKLSKQIE